MSNVTMQELEMVQLQKLSSLGSLFQNTAPDHSAFSSVFEYDAHRNDSSIIWKYQYMS